MWKHDSLSSISVRVGPALCRLDEEGRVIIPSGLSEEEKAAVEAQLDSIPSFRSRREVQQRSLQEQADVLFKEAADLLVRAKLIQKEADKEKAALEAAAVARVKAAAAAFVAKQNNKPSRKKQKKPKPSSSSPPPPVEDLDDGVGVVSR